MLSMLKSNSKKIVNSLLFGGIGIASLCLIKNYFNGPRNQNFPNLQGQVAVITGGYSGIGYETALGLAKLKATVIICGRQNKWRQALEIIYQLKKLSSNQNIFFYPLDLDDLESVKKFVGDFKASHNRLDILVNNAGVMMILEEERTKQNVEMQFGVNHLAHFYLTISFFYCFYHCLKDLLDLMKQTPNSRIINVSSKAFTWANFDFEALKSNKATLAKYSPMITYGNSKLANILFTKYLQNLISNYQMKCVSLHPGVVRTNLRRYVEGNIFIKALTTITYPFYWLSTKSTEFGAQTSLYCCTKEFEHLEGGEYYADCKVKQINHKQLNLDSMQKLWNLSLELCNQNDLQF